MKTGFSDTIPALISYSDGKMQIAYDVEEHIRNDMDSAYTDYKYSYVELEGDITRGKIVDAIIGNVHTKDAEIALINNELSSPGTEQYVVYTALRLHAKQIADEVLAAL